MGWVAGEFSRHRPAPSGQVSDLAQQGLQESFRGRILAGKALATLLIVAGLVLLGLTGQAENSAAAVRLAQPYASSKRLTQDL